MFTQPIPFGKYYLLERINVGGMAEVFKAKTFGVEGFERLLAVKRILPNIAEDGEFIEMFIDEAKIAVELHHANIAQIYDLGRVEGAFFIALEYIHGKDLRAIFDRARKLSETIPIPMACYSIMKVCEGIDYAHNKRDEQGREMNLVHRDISPQNILVSYEGEVKIIDFGIAKAANKASKTQAGILKGKFGYMSPEQVRGLPLDRRSDIFSVGIVLYELLTGERLFLGESDFSTLEKVRNVEIMPPTLHNPKIPEELEAIVFKALAKNVEERYEHAIDLHDDLQRFLYGAGSFFSRKDLAQHMKRSFSEELVRENAQIEAYRKIQPPSHEEEGFYHDAPNGGYPQYQSPSLAEAVVAAAHVSHPSRRNTPLPGMPHPGYNQRNTPFPGTVLPPGPSRRNTPLPGTVLPPGPMAQSRRNTPLSGQMYSAHMEDPSLPAPSSAFSSGFVGVVPSEPSTGHTQLIDDSDILIEEEQSDSFFSSAQSVQRASHTGHPNGPDLFDELAQNLPPSGPHPSIGNRPIPPHLPAPGLAARNELLAPDAIPPVIPITGRSEGMATKKLVGLVALGVTLVAALALGLYFLLVGSAKGTLVITTTPPDADVFVDNQPLEDFSSPKNILLEVGLHRVTVIHDSYNSISKDVVIREGESEMLQVVLPSKDGTPSGLTGPANRGDLYLDSEPAGAEIFIDDVPRPEKTPALLKGLPTGPHTVKIISPDPNLAPFVSTVEIKTGGSPEVIKAKFDSLRGSLSITSDPSGARVSLYLVEKKKTLKYTTPATISDLPLGQEIEVSVEKSGYPKFSKTITLEDTEPFSLAVPLGSSNPAPKENPKNNTKPPKNNKENNTTKLPKETPDNTPPPSGDPGFLTVGSSPSCECIINGKSRGFTPCISIEVKPGKQTVRLKNKDFGIDETFGVSVKPGEKKKFNKKFDVK